MSRAKAIESKFLNASFPKIFTVQGLKNDLTFSLSKKIHTSFCMAEVFSAATRINSGCVFFSKNLVGTVRERQTTESTIKIPALYLVVLKDGGR